METNMGDGDSFEGERKRSYSILPLSNTLPSEADIHDEGGISRQPVSEMANSCNGTILGRKSGASVEGGPNQTKYNHNHAMIEEKSFSQQSLTTTKSGKAYHLQAASESGGNDTLVDSRNSDQDMQQGSREISPPNEDKTEFLRSEVCGSSNSSGVSSNKMIDEKIRVSKDIKDANMKISTDERTANDSQCMRTESSKDETNDKEAPNDLHAYDTDVLASTSMEESSVENLLRQPHDDMTNESFVHEFLGALMAQKPRLSEAQKQSLCLKVLEQKERKRKVNRLSAQRKRMREKGMLDSLSETFKKLAADNQALKRDSDQLKNLIAVVKNLPKKEEVLPAAVAASSQQGNPQIDANLQQIGSLLMSLHDSTNARDSSLVQAPSTNPTELQQPVKERYQGEPNRAIAGLDLPQPIANKQNKAHDILTFLQAQKNQASQAVATVPPPAAPALNSIQQVLETLLKVNTQQPQTQSQPQNFTSIESANLLQSQLVALLQQQSQPQPQQLNNQNYQNTFQGSHLYTPTSSSIGYLQMRLQGILNRASQGQESSRMSSAQVIGFSAEQGQGQAFPTLTNSNCNSQASSNQLEQQLLSILAVLRQQQTHSTPPLPPPQQQQPLSQQAQLAILQNLLVPQQQAGAITAPAIMPLPQPQQNNELVQLLNILASQPK